VVEVAGGVTEGGRRPERAVGAEGAPMAGAEAHHVA